MYYSVFGDSISTFHGIVPAGYAVFYTRENAMLNSLSGAEDLWWHPVIQALGGELLVDAAYSGGRVSGVLFPAGCSERRIAGLARGNVPDGILIYLGFNDYGFGVPLRSAAEQPDPAYFEDAYTLMLRRLRQTYPEALIYCGTLLRSYITFHPEWELPELNNAGIAFEDYNAAIRRVCGGHDRNVMLCDLAATGIRYETLDGSHGTRRGQAELAQAWLQTLGITAKSPQF